MTDPTNPIPPALTPCEWAAKSFERRTRPTVYPTSISARLGSFFVVGEGSAEGVTLDDPAHIAAAVALANAALPDDDPRKLKQADVALLRGYAEFFRRENLQHPRLAELDALADKLAALLPPEAK